VSEKQRHKRVHTQFLLSWKPTFQSTVNNISRGGLYFRSPHPPEVGGCIDLDFTLPDSDQRIRGTGIVRWVSNNSFSTEMNNLFGVGIEFDKLDPQSTQIIEEFVTKNLANEAPGKRQHKRFSIRLVVDYSFSGEKYRTIANDIGKRGMFLVTTEPLQLDDIIHLRFHLPKVEGLIKARATVRWRHDAIPETLSSVVTPGMGVEFTDISEEDLMLIEQFLLS
jgi:uncharacterized protein (TIGR02266 family)